VKYSYSVCIQALKNSQLKQERHKQLHKAEGMQNNIWKLQQLQNSQNAKKADMYYLSIKQTSKRLRFFSSALEVFLNDMRYINSRFTYFTYLQVK